MFPFDRAHYTVVLGDSPHLRVLVRTPTPSFHDYIPWRSPAVGTQSFAREDTASSLELQTEHAVATQVRNEEERRGPKIARVFQRDENNCPAAT